MCCLTAQLRRAGLLGVKHVHVHATAKILKILLAEQGKKQVASQQATTHKRVSNTFRMASTTHKAAKRQPGKGSQAKAHAFRILNIQNQNQNKNKASRAHNIFETDMTRCTMDRNLTPK